MVYNTAISKGEFLKTFNIGNIASGIYYLRLSGAIGSETQKVVINK